MNKKRNKINLGEERQYHYITKLVNSHHDETLDEFYYTGMDDVDWALLKTAASMEGAKILLVFDGFDKIRIKDYVKKIDDVVGNCEAEVFISADGSILKYNEVVGLFSTFMNLFEKLLK